MQGWYLQTLRLLINFHENHKILIKFSCKINEFDENRSKIHAFRRYERRSTESAPPRSLPLLVLFRCPAAFGAVDPGRTLRRTGRLGLEIAAGSVHCSLLVHRLKQFSDCFPHEFSQDLFSIARRFFRANLARLAQILSKF